MLAAEVSGAQRGGTSVTAVTLDPAAAGASWPGGGLCAGPACVLDVRAGEPGVRGAGEWAVRPDGVVTSRRRVGGEMFCDVCARAAGEEEP